MRLRALAPAKINLFLHVGPPQDSGLHPLAGLSAFADVGDVLTLDTDGPGGLIVEGPMARGVPTGPENLVVRALDAFAAATGLSIDRLTMTLDKRLPPASGIGGGSSDAGAALRLARAALAPGLSDRDLLHIARTLGADGPMCLFPTVAWTEGFGEVLSPEPRLAPLHAVLVNPDVPVPTGAVFAEHDRGPIRAADRPDPPADWSVGSVVAWLSAQRNDLGDAAERLCPAIAQARAALGRTGARLVRMSGSGATVFGLYLDAADASGAARAIAERHSDWWIEPSRLHSIASPVAVISTE